MTYTEMVCFRSNGEAEFYNEIKNSWRGMVAISRFLENKYLPLYRPSFIPSHIDENEIENYLGYKPTRTSAFEDGVMNEIWQLIHSEKLSKNEKIVLGSTFDRVLIKRENFEETIQAFRVFEGTTNLNEQANILEQMLREDDIIAVGWNQTSVSQ